MTQRSLKKASRAFRTIGEVAELLNVEQHVLRFWETKFSQIKPLKRGGGRRYYRPEDVAVVERVHFLLYKEGYTIKGAQNVLKGSTRNKIALAANDVAETKVSEKHVDGLSSSQKEALQSTLQTLKTMRKTLLQVS